MHSSVAEAKTLGELAYHRSWLLRQIGLLYFPRLLKRVFAPSINRLRPRPASINDSTPSGCDVLGVSSLQPQAILFSPCKISFVFIRGYVHFRTLVPAPWERLVLVRCRKHREGAYARLHRGAIRFPSRGSATWGIVALTFSLGPLLFALVLPPLPAFVAFQCRREPASLVVSFLLGRTHTFLRFAW